MTNPFDITLGGGSGDEAPYINSAIRGLTLGGWFYFDNTASVNEYLMSRWNNGVSQAYRIMRLSTGFVRASIDTGAGAFNVNSSVAVGAGVWTWIVMRFDPSTSLDVFINRTKTSNTTAVPADIQSIALDFTVGADSVGANFFDGRASALFVCVAALPDVTINTLFDKMKAAYNVTS